MRGAALYFLRQVPAIDTYDAVLATDMMDLAGFRGLVQKKIPPVLFYFHENQLSYPLSQGEKRDFHMGFTNIISAAAADRVMFNSDFHLNAFMATAEKLISRLPDYRPAGLLECIREKTEVAYPGCRFHPGKIDLDEKETDPPLIIWNHRWEHDKNPGDFFDALIILKNENIPFSLAVMGENFGTRPPVFQKAREQLKDRIKVFDFVASRQAYLSWLKKGAVVVSSAVQENFGISVVEAVRYGCLPLLPDRLSYPELIPKKYHTKVMYRTKDDLTGKLKNMLTGYHTYKAIQGELSREMERFAWCTRIKQYDDALKHLQKTAQQRAAGPIA